MKTGIGEIAPPSPEVIAQVTKAMMAEGKIIEAGWVGMKLMCVPLTASETQLTEMRKAFFAGAQHLLASVMSTLDEGAEPTDDDMELMNKIHQELETFKRELIDSVSV